MTNRYFGGCKIPCLALALLVAGCGGGSGQDAGSAGQDATTCGTTNAGSPTSLCTGGGLAAPLCPSKPALTSVTDLSGTWVLRTLGAQLVKVPSITQTFQLGVVSVILVQVTQTGTTVALDGQYCDRIQQDDPNNPAKVIVLDAWRLTPSPVHRSGTFAPDDTGKWTLTLPSTIEVFGARLPDPACDVLPTDPNNTCLADPNIPCLVDVDNDGYPGLSIGLKGAVNGILRSVQRQVTTLTGQAVAENRVEGGMLYEGDQTIVMSDPDYIKCLYMSSTTIPDSTPCSSSFMMVKAPDSPVATAMDCDWVRANEAALFGP